jgi:DNA-binding MarR family transcriptional regulator
MDRERDNKIARTVMLTDRDISDASRILSKLLDHQPKLSTQVLSCSSSDAEAEVPDRFALRRRASEILRMRLSRAKHFNPSMFGEPAWDMLLALYVHDDSRFTISRLGRLTGLAKTTVLRWLDYLVDQDLVWRESHPTDSRAVFVELTDTARHSLDTYFSETLKSPP